MKTKSIKLKKQAATIDKSLNKFKDRDLFPTKTKIFNDMVARIGEQNFMQFTGAQKLE